MSAVLEREHSLTVRQHSIAGLDESGDTKTIWNPDDEVEVKIARRTFDDFKKKGYLVYSVGKNGEKNTLMREFDPEAEKMIAVPPVVGG